MGSMNNEITAGLINTSAINTSDAMWPQAVAGTVSIFLNISESELLVIRHPISYQILC